VYSTRAFLSLFYDNTGVILNDYKPLITIEGHKIIGVAPNCNGLELMVLYVGFIACFPTTRKRTINYIVFGLLAIFVLNILRCSAIAWLNINYKHWVDFGHKIAFKVMMYSLIFYIWVRYTKNYFSLIKRKTAQ
jgi:exosortase/archaeosortase family protein